MTQDGRLEELLDRWEDLREQGQDPDIEDLCREYPELADRLREWTGALKATEWMCRPLRDEDHLPGESGAHAGTSTAEVENISTPPRRFRKRNLLWAASAMAVAATLLIAAFTALRTAQPRQVAKSQPNTSASNTAAQSEPLQRPVPPPPGLPGQGQGPGRGMGPGAGQGQGPGPGEGQGPGPGEGQGPGPEERFGTSGQGGPGAGPGPGMMAGPVESAPREMMPNEPIPGENYPMNMAPMNPMANNAAGGGAGGGANAVGPQNLFGPRVENLAGPRIRLHNLGPEPDRTNIDRPTSDVYEYRPTSPHFDPRYRFDPRYGLGQSGDAYGGGDGDLARTGLPEMPEVPLEVALYISAGNDGKEGGKIYQVNDVGRILGIVNLSYQATGLAIHRNHGLIAVTPRAGGKIYRVDNTGQLSVIVENSPKLPFPVDIGVAGDSDTIVVADSMADILAATNIAGVDPIVLMRCVKDQYKDQRMSVAVTCDKHVMFGAGAQRGIYRFSPNDDGSTQSPILTGSGGVAADPKSPKWAATQSPDSILVYEGEKLLHTFKLASGRSFYRQGLLSFAPSGAVVVASRSSDEVDKEVWLTAYEMAEGKQGQIVNLFPWNRERILDFVVGPRMLWQRDSPSTDDTHY